MAQTASDASTLGRARVPLAVMILIVVGFFATTLPQPAVLGKLPLQNLLKAGLHIGANDMSTFFLVVGLPWYFKPFAGILTDAFPLFGTRRRWYLILSCLCASLSWIALAFVPRTFNSLLYTGIVVNSFMVIASTVLGAYMVEAGQQFNATGRVTAVRQFVQNVATLLNGPWSGALATGAFAAATGTAAALVAVLIPFAWFYLRERRVSGIDQDRLTVAGRQFKTIFTSKTLWSAAGFMFLLYIAPGFGTPLYYIQTDVLHFSQQMIGNLGVFAGAGGIASAVLYGFLCKGWSLRPLLYLGIALAAAGSLFYLLYKNYPAAIGIETQNQFAFTLAELAVMDLALRATPKGCEGFGFSLLMSVRNLAIFGTDKIGSYLYDILHVPFNNLVFYNAGTTAFVLLLIPFLPKMLVSSKDDEGTPPAVEEAALDPTTLPNERTL